VPARRHSGRAFLFLKLTIINGYKIFRIQASAFMDVCAPGAGPLSKRPDDAHSAARQREGLAGGKVNQGNFNV
jgi:hypothetical protein